MALMASACMSAENFLDGPATCTSFGWLSHRLSSGCDDESAASGAKAASSPSRHSDEGSDPEASGTDVSDFEFRLEDPIAMLPADELFSEGKLVPLQVTSKRSTAATTTALAFTDIRSGEVHRRTEDLATDPYLFSPKAPSCSTRWKELLGLKKLHLQSSAKRGSHKPTSSLPHKSVRPFLHRSAKSSSPYLDASLSLPLLRESECESMSLSTRLSLSSSSSGPDYDDIPSRLSLDSDKPNHNPSPSHPASQISVTKNPNPARVRVMNPRAAAPFSSSSDHLHNPNTGNNWTRIGRRVPSDPGAGSRVASVDSPRMNSSGKVVFQGLERSSSSPSSFNGCPRCKHRAGIERSYSANVRVTPVLNVPVCSLRGSSISGVFGLFSSPQKRESTAGSAIGGGNRASHQHGKNRSDRP